MQKNSSKDRAILLASILELQGCLNEMVLKRQMEGFEEIKATLLERVDRLNGNNDTRYGDSGTQSPSK